MSKRTVKLLAIAMLLVLPSSPAAPAAAGVEISVYVDGVKLDLDQPPIIQSGRVLVPFRAIFAALGAEVDWDADTQTVTGRQGDRAVRLTVGQATAYRNGQPVTLDAPAVIMNGRTLVPLRFVGEALDAAVRWEQATLTVYVESAGYRQKPVAWREGKVDELPDDLRDFYRYATSGDYSDARFYDIFFMDMTAGGNTFMLMVWANRPTAGYALTAERVYEEDGVLVLEFRCQGPGPDDVVAQVTSHPDLIAVVEGLERDVHFRPVNEDQCRALYEGK